MRCNCESSFCRAHRPAHCRQDATTLCDWVGRICTDCATVMRATGGACYLGLAIGDAVTTDYEGLDGRVESFTNEGRVVVKLWSGDTAEGPADLWRAAAQVTQ